MLPSVRPRYGSEPPLGPYGSSRTESTSTRRALGTLLHTGSPDPVSPTVAPYNFLPFVPALAAVDGLCRRDRSSIHAAFDQQRPGYASRFIGQGHGHQHLRFARQHSRQPRSFRPAALTSPAHNRARAEDQQTPNGSFAPLRPEWPRAVGESILRGSRPIASPSRERRPSDFS